MRYTPLAKYKPIPGGFDPSKCVYCGALAEQQDHVPPISLQYHYQHTLENFWLVPCCRECNMVCAGHDLETIQKRLQYIFCVYTKRYPASGATSEQKGRISYIRNALQVFGVRNPFDVEPTRQKILHKPLPLELPQPDKKEITFEPKRAYKGPRTRAIILWEENVRLKAKIQELECELRRLKT